MKTACLLQDTNLSEKNYQVLTECNNVVNTSLDDCIILTNNVSSKCIKNDCSVINSSEISNFSDGLAIAFDTDSAIILQRAVIRCVKVLYLWDLNFLYKTFDFVKLAELFNSPELVLVTRSKTHDRLIENMFGRKSDFIVEQFRLDKIWLLLEKEEDGIREEE